MKIIYETKDGKQFTDAQEAKEYELKLSLLESCRNTFKKLLEHKWISDSSGKLQDEVYVLIKILEENTNF